MFKKLKDKIAEEVKQSPLKSVQQLAQAVVSPTSSSVFEPSSSNDKFCIEEDDIEEDEKQEQVKPGGFTSVTLTGQTTSPVRDQNYGYRTSSKSFMTEADNFFPVFESQPSNFHVQSDWESASEVEDRYSQLEHINKESLYEAYRKVYNRYTKVKNKYHEIVTHYRQLEREKEKAKTVLTETQDKALLRISELREQCLLEQQAKAHLEEALRNELEERDHIINTLKTKVQYLKGASDGCVLESLVNTPEGLGKKSQEEMDNLIDFSENSTASQVPIPFDASSSEETVSWFIEKIKSFKNLLNDESAKIDTLRSKLLETKRDDSTQDFCLNTIKNSTFSSLEKETEEEINETLTNLIMKLSQEIQCLHRSAATFPGLKFIKEKFSQQSKSVDNINNHSLLQDQEYKFIQVHAQEGEAKIDSKMGSVISPDICNEELNRCIGNVTKLEEENKTLRQKLEEESRFLDELKNKINIFSTVSNALKAKLKMLNESMSFDVTNCSITDQDDELILEWNACVKYFSTIKSELLNLQKIKKDLENDLIDIKNEKNKCENITKEIIEQNSKQKEELGILQNELKGSISKIEELSGELVTLKETNEKLKKTIKGLEVSLAQSEKEISDHKYDAQKIESKLKGENNEMSSKIVDLKSELENLKTNCLFLMQSKETLSYNIKQLKKDNSDMILQKEILTNNINELEQKLKKSEEEYMSILNERDRLDNEINSLTKQVSDLQSEKSEHISKIINIEKDLDLNKVTLSRALEEKENLLSELSSNKENCKLLAEEKVAIQSKYDDLINKYEQSNKESKNTSEVTNQLSEELKSLRKDNEKLKDYKTNLETVIEKLKKEHESLMLNYSLGEQSVHKLSEEIRSIKHEHDNLIIEKEALCVEMERFQKEHHNLTTENLKYCEDIKILEKVIQNTQEKSSDDNQKLSEELLVLKKEQEKWMEEKYALENRIKTLESELLPSVEKVSTLSKENNEISNELVMVKNECDSLLKDKKAAENTLEIMIKDFKSNKNELLSKVKVIEQLTNEIQTLKEEYNLILEEKQSLQYKYDNISTILEQSKEQSAAINEKSHRLNEQLQLLKSEHEDTCSNLNKTTEQLEYHKNLCSDLNDQLNSLSESFQSKCQELNEKCVENKNQKTDIDTLIQKVSHTSCLLEKLTKEKNSLLNYLVANFNNVKIVKELQQNLHGLVMQFRTEISDQFQKINTRLEHDKLKFVEGGLDRDSCSLKEGEYIRKKYIDSYNSKLKNLQEGTNSEEIINVSDNFLENTSNVGYEQNSLNQHCEEKDNLNQRTKVDGSSLFDERTYSSEICLQQAISLMKSFTNLINHNSLINDHEFCDMFESLNNDKYFKLNEKHGRNFQKEIAAIESFVTEYETKHRCLSADFHQKLKEKRVNSDNNNDSLEMHLKQEIMLKEDIIKKLQSVIEEYEQTKHSEEICHQKISSLEEENKKLIQSISQLEESHELNVKNIISEYERKLEEVGEEKSLYDFEKLGKENKFMVSEMKEQIQNLQQDLDERGDAYEKLYIEHHQTIKDREEEVAQLRARQEKDLREQDKKWRQCLDRRLAEEENRHQLELQQLNSQWNSERRELETARRLAVSAVESGSSSSELLRRQIQALTLQLTELQNNRCEMCESKKKKDEGQEEYRPRSIQDCTEMEYLRNILYEYMMGKEPLVLAKVLCALMKFDDNQTKEIVSKEEHKITLFGQLGLL